MKTLLNVPLIKQKDKHDCGVACGMMLLKYYNKKADYEELSSSIKRNKEGKINIFNLASALYDYNLKPKIQFFNYLFFEDCFEIKEIIKNFKNIKGKNKKESDILESIILAKQKGISVSHKIFFINDIERLIKNKSPVIALVSVADFRGIKLDIWRGHFIVITGFDKRNFYYNDPHWDDNKFGKHKIEKSRLMISIFRTQFPALVW